MKIAITIDPEIPVPPLFYGGIERIVDMLIKQYLDLGHEVTLFANPNSQVPCKLIPYPVLHSRGFRSTLRNSLHLNYHIIKGNFDVIHSFSRLAYLSLLLPQKIKKVMSYQREPTPKQIILASKLAKKNTLIFTGCSNYISNQIKDLANATTVYNGVILDHYNFQESVAPEAPLVFLGRIEEIKGTHIAIDVAKQTGKQLIIAGNIPTEANTYFKTKIEPQLNEQIKYIGPVNDKQKNEFLGKALAFLMPILWNEPFGIVMAEALACGTPIIGFNRGSVPEIVEHGVNGFLCSNTDEMVAATHQIQELSRIDARRSCERHFSAPIIAKQYLSVYQKNG